MKQVQIGVLTAERSIFWAKKRDFRPFRATFSVKKFGPLLCDFLLIARLVLLVVFCLLQHKS